MNAALTKIAAALTVTLASASAFADEAKHFRHGGFHRPYVVPAPVYRPVVPAPVVVHRPHYVNHGYHHNYGHHRGYWRNGRWIAPVVVGAAVLGTIAAANSYYPSAPAVTYVNPAPTYIAPVVTVPSYVNNAFANADANRDGVIDKWEAGYNRDWDRWFYDIDVNRDGVLTQHEIAQWSAHRRAY
jgi:hypothetical protein